GEQAVCLSAGDPVTTSGSGEALATDAWLAENQRALMAEIASLRSVLRGEPASATDLTPQSSPARSGALDAVCDTYGLSAFERTIVTVCAAPEFDGQFGELLATVQGRPDRCAPTFGLCLAAFLGAHWSALQPGAPLRYWHLIELGPGPLTAAPLHIDEWLLHVLTGAGGLDQRLVPVMTPLEASGRLSGSAEAAVAALAVAWAGSQPLPPVVLRGTGRQSRRAIVAEACDRLGWRPYVLNASDIPAGAAEQDTLLRLWQRGAMLERAALLVECPDTDDTGVRGALDRFVDRLTTPSAVALADGGRAGTRPGPTVDAPKPSRAEQREIWLHSLGVDERFAALNGAVDRVIDQFDMEPSAIAVAAAQALNDGHLHRTERDAGSLIWSACRDTTRGGLDQLAQRLQSTATFDDLVLPDPQRSLLGDILVHIRHRSRVYDEWGMAGPSLRGLGVSALFAGPSGTGKTLAAEVLANAMALDLYRIDLSQVVSKYIGETEKNLRRIFEAATGSGAVLLFDEADALFGKRSEVRDSHDRYANVEISYLLQAMESYRGLAVLTTNMRGALDPAFMRRLRFLVTFPFPNAAQRAEIWRRAFPPATPTQGLNVAKLAQLTVAGGNIRAIALHAAFTAAEAGVPVGMREVLHAAVAEYAKLERPLSDTEIGGWT
ncbi:MAG TPA: ATP-binding protein, partial [Mycobacterium sp.]|nr:ATP-binding protein [Mycobacterium sp.]